MTKVKITKEEILERMKPTKPKKLIKINADTHARLEKLGSKLDTFDSIINKLIDEHQYDRT